MELRHIRYFLELCETSHFGRAAQRLYTSQPNLSRQIRGLERELGCALFARDRRGMEITEAGRKIIPLARQLKELENQIRSTVSGRASVKRVVIGHVPAALTSIVPRALRVFKKEFPHLDFRLREMFPSPLIAALRSGEADLGFGVEAPPAGFGSAPLAAIPYSIVLRRSHRLARGGKPVSLQRLRGERWITIPDEFRPQGCRLLARMRGLGFGEANRTDVETQQAIIGLVAAGEGFAVMPHGLSKLRFPEVVFRRPLERLPDFNLTLIWRKNDRDPETRRFVASARGLARRLASG